jgi:hypothetical protein
LIAAAKAYFVQASNYPKRRKEILEEFDRYMGKT